MAMPVALGGLNHCLDLGRRQVLSSLELGVWAPVRSNCSIYCIHPVTAALRGLRFREKS
jgi:hypothetical protein